MRHLAQILAILAAILATPPASAAALPALRGAVVLELRGAITETNDGRSARFDIAGLQSLPLAEINTVTPWTEGETRFEGVLLRDLLAAVGAQGSRLHAVALNDYAVDIPVADASLDVLVAYRMDGQALSVRDKGPLWIIYPLSQHPGIAGPDTEGKMIWQLRTLIVQ
jgi:hypothetical protein